MFCTNCGNELPNDHKFCGKCGNKMQEQPVEMDKAAAVLVEEPEFMPEQNLKVISSEMQQVEQSPVVQTLIEQTQTEQTPIIPEQESQLTKQQQVQPVQQQQVQTVQPTQQEKPIQGQPINERQVQQQSAQNVQQAPQAQIRKIQPMQTENYQNSEAPTIQQAQLAVPTGYDRILSMWTYLGMLIVSWIPLIGFIATIAWVVKKGNKNKRRLAAAMLILQIIGIAAGIFVYPATISLLKTVLKGLNTDIG